MTLQISIVLIQPQKNHCITFSDSELKTPLHINSKFEFFHTRRPTYDELRSCEKIFITTERQNWNPYCTLYELRERSMLNYNGDITQENCQKHHLVDQEMDKCKYCKIHKFDHQVGTALCILEAGNPWANRAELYIVIFK